MVIVFRHGESFLVVAIPSGIQLPRALAFPFTPVHVMIRLGAPCMKLSALGREADANTGMARYPNVLGLAASDIYMPLVTCQYWQCIYLHLHMWSGSCSLLIQ